MDFVASELARMPYYAEGFKYMMTRFWQDRPSIADINLSQVRGDTAAFLHMLSSTFEIEEPWQAYTRESMAYFADLPALAMFMERVWQNDERRHPAVLGALYHQLTGAAPGSNIHTVHPVTGDVAHHLYTRLGAEIGAAATYSVLAARAEGSLRVMLRHLAGDEFRHLAVFWAASKQVLGGSATARLAKLAGNLRDSALGHRANRTALQSIGFADYRLAAEIGATVARVFWFLWQWDGSATLRVALRSAVAV